jgi:rhodanese-related sulfurtransferase
LKNFAVNQNAVNQNIDLNFLPNSLCSIGYQRLTNSKIYLLREVIWGDFCHTADTFQTLPKNIMVNSHEMIEGTRSKVTPTPVLPIAKSTAAELKSRLNQDKSDLTIVDIRTPTAFNREHITGAISVPLNRLEDLAQSALSPHREIYIYGESDEQSLHGLRVLISTGFLNVAQIIGGLTTWRELVGATEGIEIYNRN